MSKKNDKIQITAEEFRALAARIADEKATPESKPAEPDERERLKTEAARLKSSAKKSAQSTSASGSGTNANTPATQTSAKAAAGLSLRYFMAASSPRSLFGQL